MPGAEPAKRSLHDRVVIGGGDHSEQTAPPIADGVAGATPTGETSSTDDLDPDAPFMAACLSRHVQAATGRGWNA